MRAFVTGSTGLIGSHLVLELLKQGNHVTCLRRKHTDLSAIHRLFVYHQANDLYKKIVWVEGDVLDIHSLMKGMQNIDYVYHCAGYVSFDDANREKLLAINVTGSANVVNAALEANIKKLCFVSSTAALGEAKNNEVISENNVWSETKNTSIYSISKHYAEREAWRASEEGLDVVIVCPSVVIGPGDWEKSSMTLFNTVSKGLLFYTEGSNGFVDVRDVASAMIQLQESDIKNERFLLISENKSFREVLDTIADKLNKPSPKYKAGKLLAGIAWRIFYLYSLLKGQESTINKNTAASALRKTRYSNEKIKSVLALNFRTVDEAVEYTSAVFLNTKQANINSTLT